MSTLTREALVDQLLQAFLKMKSDVFFDKTMTFARDKVVCYEGNRFIAERNETFIRKLERLADALMDTNETSWTEKLKEIVDTVDYAVLPKSIKDYVSSEKDEFEIITNHNPQTPATDHVQCFLDMDAEGFLLGMLWVLYVGFRVDKTFGECSYGRRIRKSVKNPFDWKPYVFQPYFAQYESWRDGALDIAQRTLHDDHKDVAILTLDIKSFFYCIDLSHDDWKQLCSVRAMDDLDEVEIRVVAHLNDFVWEVIKRYSQHFTQPSAGKGTEKHPQRTMLPIGFYPSPIIANWCMSKFDQAVSNTLNPAFYGRYVDDIIIVEKLERDSNLQTAYQKNRIALATVMELVSGYGDKKLFLPDQSHENVFIINPAHLNAAQSVLAIQPSKAKLFYFDHEAPDALIKEFRSVIAKNSSSFKLMPHVDETDLQGSFAVVYSLKNDGSPNKLREVEAMSVDSYELSKFLGKLQRIIPLVTDGIPHQLCSRLVNLLDESDLLRFHTVWEKMFTILLAAGDGDELVRLIERIAKALTRLSYEPYSADGTNYEPEMLWNLSQETVHQRLVETLGFHALSCLSRTLALSQTTSIENVVVKEALLIPSMSKRGITQTSITELKALYRATYMIDKYATAMHPLATVPRLATMNTTCSMDVSKESWQGSLFSLQDSLELISENWEREPNQSKVGPLFHLHKYPRYEDFSCRSAHTIPLLPYVIKASDLVLCQYYASTMRQ